VDNDKRRSTPKRELGSSKRSPRTRWIIQAIIVVLVATVVASALVGDQGLLATLRARQEYNELSQTIARQRAENARLREEARRLREDPAAIEEVARRELGLIRPGEKVFILKDLPPTSREP
jgi:cell division protein FtsB